ncbi:MAG: FAD-dependent oxidoreductase [Chloroflexi bacterium]|nr:FAD-dependent oxidoreductase [Chloroflexota bacterium]
MIDCIVIGAGAAGLAAARLLHNAGREVLVLEAQDRIGGRIRTDETWADFPVELGAEFIHGEGAATHGLLDACGLSAVAVARYAGMWWGWGAEAAKPRAELPREAQALLAALDGAYSALADTQEDVSLADYLRGRGFDGEAVATADVLLAQTCCAPVEHLSTADLAREMRADRAGKHEYRVRGGYGALLAGCAAGLEVRLNEPVTRVAWGAGGVRIETVDAEYAAKTAIVTVSVGVLRAGKIAFAPALSAGKQAAIAAMPMLAATKLIYRFETPMWDARMIYLLHRGKAARWWTQGNVISCYVTAERAERIDALPESEALALGLAELSALLGKPELAARCLAAKRVSWAREAYIGGGYAYVQAGAADARPALAAPEGERLFFAGEATAYDSNPQTVHGALESGWRAAREAMAAMAG